MVFKVGDIVRYQDGRCSGVGTIDQFFDGYPPSYLVRVEKSDQEYAYFNRNGAFNKAGGETHRSFVSSCLSKVSSYVYVVNEVHQTSRFLKGPAHGYFTNFEAARDYIISMQAPITMVIVKCMMHDQWPSKELSGCNDLTYYQRINDEWIEIS